MKKKKHTKHPEPEYEVDFTLLSRIAYEVWPKDTFNTIKGIAGCQHFYNLSYNRFHEELIKTLDKYHPAVWVREGYLQLELWTWLFMRHERKSDTSKVKGPAMLAPIGRYGWRYVIEISLEKAITTIITHASRPDRQEVARVFTILVALGYCSEHSNYLHYFKSNLSSASLKLSPYLYTKELQLEEKEKRFYESIISYIQETPDWRKYQAFSAEKDDKLMYMINQMLEKYFGFNLLHAKTLAKVFVNRISTDIGASVLVTTYEEAIVLFSAYTQFPAQLCRSIIDFILLDVQTQTYKERDFLSRSQQKRMLNFSGAMIYLNNNLETIYDPTAAKFDFVIASPKHIILTGTLVTEWLDVFVSRLVYGQRQDLKNVQADINQAISAIEAYYHKNIFETSLTKLITAKGYHCISIDKVNGTTIACGEIDIIAYHPAYHILLVIEAKNHAPAKDARSMGKVISDHFRQKKYHQKFLSKINWVKDHLEIVHEIYKKQFNIHIEASPVIEPYFITGSSNAVKFLVTDYKVYTFYEFDKALHERK